MRVLTIIAAAAIFLTAGSANADPAEAERASAAQHWRALARLDLDAAYAMLKDNHPAMAAELGDAPFIARIDAAYAEGLTRIEKIDNFYGLRAVLEGFANAAGDKHVGAGFGLMRQYTIWPMFLVKARGADFIVTRRDGDADAAPAEGARLISCDGTPAEEFARARIGAFHANWAIEAERASQAWRLFVNDRNPFLTPVKTCRFESKGVQSDVPIAWNATSYDVIAPVIARTQASAGAGFGVRKLKNGAYWISIESLDQKAEAVIGAVSKDIKAINAAPYVVVDVRGNGGGSSSYGDRLADLLLGPAKASDDSEPTGEAWRVSPGNAAGMKDFAAQLHANGSNAELVKWADDMAAQLQAGVEKGARFTPALPSPLPAAPQFSDPKGGADGARVYLLTDHSCFSSCLLMTWTFKSRGAVQVGQPTDAATRYMENRETLLPSKLASFSTLQKVSLGAPPQIGPFEPSQRFNGDLGDTKALEAWIAKLAGH
jgi:hypothetical protein